MADPNDDSLESQGVTCETGDPLERLLESVAGKEESLEKLLTLVQSVDQKGYLQVIGYLVDDLQELVDAGVDMLARPQVFSLISTASRVRDAAKEVDPSKFPEMARAFNHFLQGMTDRDADIQIHGMLDLIKLLKDPDIRVALNVIFSGLKSLGQGIRTTP